MFFVYYLQYDLQWLMIHCDPTKPEREGCSELPVSNDNCLGLYETCIQKLVLHV